MMILAGCGRTPAPDNDTLVETVQTENTAIEQTKNQTETTRIIALGDSLTA